MIIKIPKENKRNKGYSVPNNNLFVNKIYKHILHVFNREALNKDE